MGFIQAIMERLSNAVAPRFKRAAWTGRESRTRADILKHLTKGPMTRAQLNAVLDVTTAQSHLPRMVEDGIISVDRTRGVYRYAIARPKTLAKK